MAYISKRMLDNARTVFNKMPIGDRWALLEAAGVEPKGDFSVDQLMIVLTGEKNVHPKDRVETEAERVQLTPEEWARKLRFLEEQAKAAHEEARARTSELIQAAKGAGTQGVKVVWGPGTGTNCLKLAKITHTVEL